MANLKHLVITLDGPAGAGKSTVAKSLARRLGISYLDTGAMYRALTLKAIRLKINLEDEAALVALARQTDIAFKEAPDGSLRVTLDGEDVAEAIRSADVTNNTFYIAKAGGVREILVSWQQAIGRRHSIVTDGRDQGTVAFPNANFKFYVDASLEERAGRRMRELTAAGRQVDFEQLKREMQERDHKDFTRAVGPLKKADDAVVIDSSGLDVEGTVDVIMKYLK